MSAPLMFVRDGRTLPFVPVTLAAIRAIRDACPQRRPYATATYIALLELANEDHSARVATTQKKLIDLTGASRSSVQRALSDLQQAGVLEAYERHHENARVENEYVVVEPSDESVKSDTPASQRGGGRFSERRRSKEGREESPNGHEDSRAQEDAFPDDLPTSLTGVAIEAGKILKRTAMTRGQGKPVTRAAVGHAVLTYPDRDHVRVARDVEAWLLHGNGARKSCRDVVARFRNFLDSSEPKAGPLLPAGVTPMYGRRLSNAEQVDERVRALRAGLDTPGL